MLLTIRFDAIPNLSFFNCTTEHRNMLLHDAIDLLLKDYVDYMVYENGNLMSESSATTTAAVPGSTCPPHADSAIQPPVLAEELEPPSRDLVFQQQQTQTQRRRRSGRHKHHPRGGSLLSSPDGYLAAPSSQPSSSSYSSHSSVNSSNSSKSVSPSLVGTPAIF